MFDLLSITVYIAVPIFCFWIAKFSERFNKKQGVWWIVILLSLVAGLRAVSVGIDTKTYEMAFELVGSGVMQGVYGMEKSFLYICKFLLCIWNHPNFLYTVFAFISHGLVLFRIWKDREYISFHWSVFAYYILFFAFSLNGMRQFVAVAIVFYATDFIKEGKYVRFIAAVFVAAMFHSSAMVGIAYLFFEIIFIRFFNQKRKLIVFLLLVVGGVLGFSIVSGLLNIYSKYFEHQAASVGLMMVVKLVLLIFSVVVIERPTDKNEYYYLSHRLNYFVGLLLNSLNYIFLYMGRIGLYFYLFEAVYIGYLFQSKNRKKWMIWFKFIYVVLLLYYLCDNVSRGSQGEMPYRFFWQS